MLAKKKYFSADVSKNMRNNGVAKNFHQGGATKIGLNTG